MKILLRTLLFVSGFGVNSLSAALVIPQAPDGAGWRFTLVATNTTTSPTAASISFLQDIGGGGTLLWTPPLDHPAEAFTIPAGSSVFFHSPGTASTLTQGWASVTGSGVQAYIIYSYTSGQSTSDATAAAVMPATGALLPFDNTGTHGTEFALVNPNSNSETITVDFDIDGVATAGTPLTIPGNGQIAVVMATQFAATAGKAGLAEFHSANTFAMIGLRSNTNPTTGIFSFTSSPTYSENGSPIITATGGGSGGGTGGGSIPSGDITFAGFDIAKVTSSAANVSTVFHSESVGGVFAAYTSTAYNFPFNGIKIGNCTVWELSYSPGGKIPSAPDLFLDGGALTLRGSGLPSSGKMLTKSNTAVGPDYSLQLPNGTLVAGATYDLSGAGGTQVDPFDVTTALPNNLTTNLQTINMIDRSKPLTVTWDGTGFPNIAIGVDSIVASATSVTQVVISCLVDASLKTFDVPAAALSHLSPVSATLPGGTGVLSVDTAPAFTGAPGTEATFTPGLVSGGKIKYGTFSPRYSEARSLPIQ